MVYIGHCHMKGISKKTQEPYDFYQLQAIVKSVRFDNVGCQTVNLSPAEFDSIKNDLVPGIQFRAFSQNDGGGIMFLPLPPIDLSCLDSML